MTHSNSYYKYKNMFNVLYKAGFTKEDIKELMIEAMKQDNIFDCLKREIEIYYSYAGYYPYKIFVSNEALSKLEACSENGLSNGPVTHYYCDGVILKEIMGIILELKQDQEKDFYFIGGR